MTVSKVYSPPRRRRFCPFTGCLSAAGRPDYSESMIKSFRLVSMVPVGNDHILVAIRILLWIPDYYPGLFYLPLGDRL